MKDRIRQLMESQHMTQQTFSDFIGISSASHVVFLWKTKPTLNTVEAIKSKFTKINLDWLLYGQGPMFKDQVTEPNSSPGEAEIVSPGVSEGILDFPNPTPSSLPETEQISSPYSDNMYKSPSRTEVKYVDKPQRRITEIRIFFDDQTWETLFQRSKS